MQDGERQSADELLSLAEDLIEKGELAEAQSLLDKIEEKSGRKYFLQSKLFVKKGWYSEARVQLSYALTAEPENHEYKAALEQITEERDKTFTDEEYFAQAEEHLKAGNHEWAQKKLDRVKAESAKKHYIQSKIYNQKKWYNEQRKQLKLAVKLEPGNEEYKRELDGLEKFRKTDEYKKCAKEERKAQLGGIAGGECAECFCVGAVEMCCYGICEGLGNC